MKKENKEFKDLAKPLMEYLYKNHHPHTSVILNSSTAELVEGVSVLNIER